MWLGEDKVREGNGSMDSRIKLVVDSFNGLEGVKVKLSEEFSGVGKSVNNPKIIVGRSEVFHLRNNNLERGSVDMTMTTKVSDEKRLFTELKSASEVVSDSGDFIYLEELRAVSRYLHKIGVDKEKVTEIGSEIRRVESKLIDMECCPECGEHSLEVLDTRESRGDCWGSPAYENVTVLRCGDCGFEN